MVFSVICLFAKGLTPRAFQSITYVDRQYDTLCQQNENLKVIIYASSIPICYVYKVYKKMSEKKIVCKLQHSQSRLKETFSFQLGGSVDVGLLSENHHKINLIAGEDLLFNESVVPLLSITSYTISLSE